MVGVMGDVAVQVMQSSTCLDVVGSGCHAVQLVTRALYWSRHMHEPAEPQQGG